MRLFPNFTKGYVSQVIALWFSDFRKIYIELKNEWSKNA